MRSFLILAAIAVVATTDSCARATTVQQPAVAAAPISRFDADIRAFEDSDRLKPPRRAARDGRDHENQPCRRRKRSHREEA